MATTPSIFLKDVQSWNLKAMPNGYPKEYSEWSKMSEDKECCSALNKSGRPAMLNAYILKALHEYAKGSNSDIGLLNLAAGDVPSFATEWHKPDGTVLARATASGLLQITVINPVNGKYEKIPVLGNRNDHFDASSVMLLYLAIEAEKNKQAGLTDHAWTWACMQAARDGFNANGFVPEDLARLASDCLQCAFADPDVVAKDDKDLKKRLIPASINAGNTVTLLPEDDIRNKKFASGVILCGDPQLMKPAECRTVMTNLKNQTIQSLRENPLVAEYVSSRTWTPEEEMLIQRFPDDTVVPEEIVKAVMRFLRSRDMRAPFVNFAWRGITGYGKSTGVAMMSCILNTPLVWMTCSSSTDREYFLSVFVPEGRKDFMSNRLPTFDDIMSDPEAAYEMLTGHEKVNPTYQEVLEAYGKAYMRTASEAPSYKLVESDYVSALERGWIVEVQEYSRIRDSGVLTALNNMDRPGAIIPMADGTKRVRHKNAITFWTDNSGYVSCRPVDPSVKRRLDTISNSFKMEKSLAIARLKQNLPDFNNNALLEKLYSVWDKIVAYCKDKEITDGDVSIVELERWAAVVQMEGEETMIDSCLECVIAKAADDPDTQDELVEFVRQEINKRI